MPAPIIMRDLSGLSEGLSKGFSSATSALSEALGKRNEQKSLKNQQSALNEAIDKADLTTEEGKVEFLKSYPDKKEALSIIKQFQPSTVDKILEQYGYGNAPQQQQGAQTPTQEQNQQQAPQTQGTLGSVINTPQQHPAIQDTPYANIPDEVLGALSASDNPRDQKFADSVSNMRSNAHKMYNEDRNYAHQKTKKYYDDIAEMRGSVAQEEIALNDIEFGLNNRDPATSTMDWWASNLNKWTEPLVSPEGALIQSGVKNYLISDLKGVKGRPNQFLEGLLLQSLPGLGKSDLANQSLMTGLRYRNDIKKLKIKLTDELTSLYEGPNGMGPVPANIDRLVAEQMKPLVDEWGDKHAYNLRRVQEKEQGVEKLSNKKVVRDTPLTIEMMTYLADEFGIDKAVKRAKQLGYKIPTKAEYERYNNASTN